MNVDRPVTNGDPIRVRSAGVGAQSAAAVETFRRSLTPADADVSLEESLRRWARAVRARGVGAGHMVAGLRELWLMHVGNAPAVPADRPAPPRLPDIIDCALTAYLQDDVAIAD